MHFVYIIFSPSANIYYKGYSLDPFRRLQQHINKESQFTSKYTDWTLVHLEVFNSKSDALKREKILKKYAHFQIENLIRSPKNVLSHFL